MPGSFLTRCFFSAVLLVCLFSCLGCGGAAKAKRELQRTLERSPVVFVCMREDGRYVVRKIYKAEPSWGSNIIVGEAIDLPLKDNPRYAGVLITREKFQWSAVNGQLAQGTNPFDQVGRLLYGRMTLQEVDEFYASRTKQTPVLENAPTTNANEPNARPEPK